MRRVLVVTNDFPPRPGGIQMFVHALTARLPDVVVYASAWTGDAVFDAAQPFPVVRHPTSLLLPLPGVLRRVRDVARAERATAVWFGAAAPLGLLAAGLRPAGVERFVASTHGHEAGWAALPGARRLLRRIGEQVDVVTYLGDYTRRRIGRALTPAAAHRMRPLAPGVDTDRFRPHVGGGAVRVGLGLRDRRVIVCVSRLVPRKGQDVLIRALPGIRLQVPDAALLLVGGGPYRRRLERLVDTVGVRDAVRFTGSVPWARLPAYYDAGDVFAMPCRTRNAGLDVEGLGIVYLEASATGLPVVAGNSGGAPEAVLDGVTGHVVDGRDVAAVGHRITRLLTDPQRAAAMGEEGRAWVEREWRWDTKARRLARMLDDRS
jgi:phosphatidylinositol alpha-1,6-mannosyltransferase